MKIIVTGYKGFIGSHVYEALVEEGHDVLGHDWEEYYGCLPYVQGYDLVIHLGANSSTTETDIGKLMKQNYDFSIRLYRHCHDYGVPFHYASSASVYGNAKTYDEDGPCHPLNPYAWSKFMFERYIEKIDIPTKIDCIGFRYFNVYGNGEQHKGEQASVFTKFQQQAKDEGKITLFEGSDNFKRDFVCVEDIVKIHKQMIWKQKINGVFNIGTGTANSFESVGKLFSAKLDVPIEYIPVPDNLKGQYQSYTKAVNYKIKRIVDIKWTTPKQWIDANVKA
jgi:ADP-L-glycero-D-manno-heptose 6-epimerase